MMRMTTLRLLARTGISALRVTKASPSIARLPSTSIATSLNLPRLSQVMHLHNLQTKGDQELSNFLGEEISAENKSSKPLPDAVDDFQIKSNEAEIILSKKFNDESIVVTLNVNHTVDAETPEEVEQSGKKPDDDNVAMKSKPSFDVDIIKGGHTLSFSCSYMRDVDPADSQEEFNDLFVIEEISLYEGEAKETTYAVAGDILDGYLYDLFMNMLEERGITNEFVEKMSDYCTNYEHSLYVALLLRLKKFVQN